MIILNSITDAVRRYVAYSRAKTELRSLDDRMLRDIGITRGEIDNLAWQSAFGAVAPRAKPVQETVAPEAAMHPAGQH